MTCVAQAKNSAERSPQTPKLIAIARECSIGNHLIRMGWEMGIETTQNPETKHLTGRGWHTLERIGTHWSIYWT